MFLWSLFCRCNFGYLHELFDEIYIAAHELRSRFQDVCMMVEWDAQNVKS